VLASTAALGLRRGKINPEDYEKGKEQKLKELVANTKLLATNY